MGLLLLCLGRYWGFIFRTVLDIGCWLYMGIVALAFLMCKIVYLVWAWKFPESYLRHRQVII